MSRRPECPRCAGAVLPPSAFSSSWRCDRHGVVAPLHLFASASPEAIDMVRRLTHVPMWLPAPMPVGWSVTGLGYAGDDRSGARATLVACSGPAPLGGPADLLLVAEEPGVGLGAGYAGIDGPDPGPQLEEQRAGIVRTQGHPTALWPISGVSDRCAVVGEAAGLWLWAILWPAPAGYLLAEDLRLNDLREGTPGDLPVGPTSPRLRR
ncbi:MAG: hypothetical protein DLM59_01885 [Pseudonocardiales bacterium]|nr:MAG: hypothetical protein DLM56_05685 [Pseudonocardiales bacterium]PZS36044.1 MAG: hypothetical protein DLM59_01885 [Pseudonocardiales bacterium]